MDLQSEVLALLWSLKSIFDQDVIGFIGLRNIANWNVDVGVLARYCPWQNVRIIDDPQYFRRPHGTPTRATRRLTPTAASRTRGMLQVKWYNKPCLFFHPTFIFIIIPGAGAEGFHPADYSRLSQYPPEGLYTHPPHGRRELIDDKEYQTLYNDLWGLAKEIVIWHSLSCII